MDCPTAREAFSDYIDGALADEAGRTLDAHLGQCEACRRELGSMRSAVSLVEDLPKVTAPTTILDRVRSHVANQGSPAKGPTPLISGPWRWAIAAAAAAALALAILVGLTSPDDGDDADARAPVAGVGKDDPGTGGAGVPGPDEPGKRAGDPAVARSPGTGPGSDSATPQTPDGKNAGPGPDNMATRNGTTPEVGPLDKLPDITPIPSPERERAGNGGLRIYIGPRSEFSGANGAPLKATGELHDTRSGVHTAPTGSPGAGAGRPREGVVLHTPNLVLRVDDLDDVSGSVRTMLRDSGAEFTRSRSKDLVRFVAVLRGARAKRLINELRELEGVEVALESLPQLRDDAGPTTLVIQLSPSD